MTEQKLSKMLHHYLSELGYPEALITSEVRTAENERVDFVVYTPNLEKPWIVIEVKSSKQFPDAKEPSRLRFDPSVRQLQRNAIALNAPYYLLTNGQSFLWFDTDDTGRPRLLKNPVQSTFDNVRLPLTHPTKEQISRIMRELANKRSTHWSLGLDTEIAVILMAQLLKEQGDENLYNALINANEDALQAEYPNALQAISITRIQNYLADAFNILDQTLLSGAMPQDLLEAIDEAFINQLQITPRVPRWLSDFMVRLGQIQDESIVLDISSDYGNTLAAAALISRNASCWGISHFSTGAAWTQLQQIVLGRKLGQVFSATLLSNKLQVIRDLPTPTHIITGLSFGGRVHNTDYSSFLFQQGVRQLEDLELEIAINQVQSGGRIVVVVPEGLLFGGGQRRLIRELIRRQTRITAIISLANGVFSPLKGIKTSILVLDKTDVGEPYEIYMAHVDRDTVLGAKAALDCRELQVVDTILNLFYRWKNGELLNPDSAYWTISSDDLDINNFAATRYEPIELTEADEFATRYPSVSLDQVTELVRRGTSIKLEDQGNIAIIGPAAIRPMVLDETAFGHTVESSLPSRASTVQAGDIVINNIGSHIGAATVINETVAGSYISQHVLLLRPITSKVLPEYLAAAINSGYVRPQFERRATGTVVPSISLRQLAEIDLPLPDIETQKRIVDRIERLHNELIQAKEKLKQVEGEFQNAITFLASEGTEL